MSQPLPLPPFKAFLASNIPSVYDNTLSYYDELTKLIGYLETVVVPAVDKNTQDISGIEAGLKELKEYVDHYFENLDVQEEINNKLDAMAEDGTLGEIINQEIFGELNDRVSTLETDTAAFEDFQKKLDNVLQLKTNVMANPLLMLKEFQNGTSGENYNYQNIAVKYDEDGVPDKIFVICNINNAATKLFIATCGERDTGTGWTYSVTSNIPVTHGSALTYCEKDGLIYIADFGNANVVKYNISSDTYTTISLSSFDINYVGGISYDDKTDEFLIGGTNNEDMYVFDYGFTTIKRTYEHDMTSDLTTAQSFDYYDGFEYRCMSVTSDTVSNYIAIYNTYTGKYVKSIAIDRVNGEIEGVSIERGFATILIRAFNVALNQIHMACVVESFIGGDLENPENILSLRKSSNSFMMEGGVQFIYTYPYFFENNYANSAIVRYAGIGTQLNPIKSALALATVLTNKPPIPSFTPTVHFMDSSNTDDSGLRIQGSCQQIRQLILRGENNPTIYGEIHIEDLSAVFIPYGFNLYAGNSRRNDKTLILFNINQLRTGGAINTTSFDIADIRSFRCGAAIHSTNDSAYSYIINWYGLNNLSSDGTLTAGSVISPQ